jgi:hypothetical protein
VGAPKTRGEPSLAGDDIAVFLSSPSKVRFGYK